MWLYWNIVLQQQQEIEILVWRSQTTGGSDEIKHVRCGLFPQNVFFFCELILHNTNEHQSVILFSY